jgi:hypothetical protein
VISPYVVNEETIAGAAKAGVAELLTIGLAALTALFDT